MGDQAQLLRRLVDKDRGARRAKVITVASGKGGVGKTNIVVNLGIVLAGLGQVTTIVDADLGLANVDVVLGQYFRYDLEHVLKGEKTLEEVIGLGPHGLRIVPSASGVPQMANMENKQRNLLIAELAKLEHTTDFLLIDTGAGISRNVLSFANLADEVIIVVTPEPTSLADAYGLVKILVKGKAVRKIALIVNRAQGIQEGKLTGERFLALTERFLNFKMRFLGYILDDAVVGQAVRKQQPFVQSYPESWPSRQLERIAKEMLGQSAEALPERGLLSGLLRLFGGR
ncbi:MAG: Flagellum site-determining protein YlxH [Firmicutes bacterium]|nr:Flagellum site-determining protein YlxH [Bacillota bacterium]MBT9152611.1 Flagellum site-determining protein YlxH [Bacillota bacterium]MBT9157028.1 Flagellum site-determining protein YlxH [Bacillota bacterium]